MVPSNMEAENMDICISDSDEEDEDDEAELSKLFSGLSGMEKYLLPRNSVTDKAIIKQSATPINQKTTPSDVTRNNNISNRNASVTISIPDAAGDNSVETISPPVSPTNSNASTLSREATPEKEISHCPKEQVTIAQLLNHDSDSDVIVDCIDSYRKTLEADAASDHSDVAIIDPESEVVCLGVESNTAEAEVVCLDEQPIKSTSNGVNSQPNPVNSESVQLVNGDNLPTPTINSQSEVELPPTAPSIEIATQSKDNENDALDKDEDSDSSSDCLIVEHTPASDYLMNGCIDLTVPTNDYEANIALQDRTEDSLLKEIEKIQHALRKEKRKSKKEKKYKHRKSPKKKKRSKSKSRTKSPSLGRLSENEDETRTIRITDGQLCVNIINGDHSNPLPDSDDSQSTLSKSNSSNENDSNRNGVCKKSKNTEISVEKFPNRHHVSDKSKNNNNFVEKEPPIRNQTNDMSKRIEKSAEKGLNRNLASDELKKIINSVEKEPPSRNHAPDKSKKNDNLVEKEPQNRNQYDFSKLIDHSVEKNPPNQNHATDKSKNIENSVEKNPPNRNHATDKSKKIENSVEKDPIPNPTTEKSKTIDNSVEKEPPNLNHSIEQSKNTSVPVEEEPNPDPISEKSNSARSSSKENLTPRPEPADSPPLWNSDEETTCNSGPVIEKAPEPEKIFINPLKRRLGFAVDTNIDGAPKKKVFCESRKELNCPFRRKPAPEWTKKRSSSRGGNRGRRGRIPSLFDNLNLFNQRQRSVESSDSDTMASSRRRVMHRSRQREKSVGHQLGSENSNVVRRRSPSKDVWTHDKYDRFMSEDENETANMPCYSPSDFDIVGRHLRSRSRSKSIRRGASVLKSRSPSYFRSSRSRSPTSYRTREPSSYPSPPRRGSISPSLGRQILWYSRYNSRSPSAGSRSFRSKSRTYRSPSPSRSRRSKSRTFRDSPHSRRSKSRTVYQSPSPSRSRRSKSRTFRDSPHSRRSKSRTVHRSQSPRSRRSKSRALRDSPSPHSRRSKSRTYRSPSPSRFRRSRSRTYRSPSRSRRSKSRTYRSPSRSRRSRSRLPTPRTRSGSRSPSEIRAARNWSPLEEMRQQLKRNNEAAVQQALGGLEKRTKSAGSKACSARVIDNLDLTQSSPPLKSNTEGSARSALTGLTFACAPATQKNVAAASQPRPTIPTLMPHAGYRPIHPSLVGMPMAPVHHNPGVLNQMSMIQISHVYSQGAELPVHYVPMYAPHPNPAHPPYM